MSIAIICTPSKATAGVLQAAEGNWLAAGQSGDHQCRSFLHDLLTWSNDGGDHENEQEEPLESDRPDFTECSTTVGYRRLQIESGYTYTQAISGDPTHDAHDLPELLVRYGVAERLELRFAWDQGMVFDRSVNHDSGRVDWENGSTDLDAGFKYAISKQDQWRPRSAILVSVSAPVGNSVFSSRQVDPVINYLYSWELTKKLSLNGSTGSQWTAVLGDRFTHLSQSLSIGYGLTEKLSVYNEWFAFFYRDLDDNRPQHYYNGGLTYLVTPNFQLDWRAGLGLNDTADGFFTGCGLTIRK
jgi:hypothetical protein